MHTYNEVTTKGGRYVQGGGCSTVGVAGLMLGGGFGSFSKTYGRPRRSLLEAEIVTADGEVEIVNACSNPELFWALKGGGGGVRRRHPRSRCAPTSSPNPSAFVATVIQATSDAAYRRLIGRFVAFYREA